MNPIKNISYEDIDDIYCKGKYGDIDIIMRKRDGYINATKMCTTLTNLNKKLAKEKNLDEPGNKQFKHWKTNARAIEEINVVSQMVAIQADQIVIELTGAGNIKGTYVHPLLIPQIASWASPYFSIQVSIIVNKYMDNKAIEEKNRQLKEKDDNIKILSDKLDIQNNKINKLLKKNKEQTKLIEEQTKNIMAQTEHIKKQTEHINKQTKKIDIIEEQNDEILQQNDELNEKIDTISETRVVRTENTGDDHCFAVLKNTAIDADEEEMYYAIRTKRKTYNSMFNRMTKKIPTMKLLLKIEFNPNSINLFDRIRQELVDTNKIITKRNYFGLNKNYTEASLILDIKKINNEKYNV